MFTNISPFPVSKSHLITDAAYNLVIEKNGFSSLQNKVLVDFGNDKPLQNDSFKIITSLERESSETEVFIFNLDTRDQAIAICLILMTRDNAGCVKTNTTTYMTNCSDGDFRTSDNTLKKEVLNVKLQIGPYTTKDNFDIVKKLVLNHTHQDKGPCDGQLTIKGSDLSTTGKQVISIIANRKLKHNGK